MSLSKVLPLLVTKTLALVIAVVVMLLSRLGNVDLEGITYLPFGDSLDFEILGCLVAYGYTLIIFCQILSLLAGEKAFVQSFLLSLVGALGYLSVGSETVRVNTDADISESHTNIMAMGSLAIINGIVLLVDAAQSSLFALKND